MFHVVAVREGIVLAPFVDVHDAVEAARLYAWAEQCVNGGFATLCAADRLGRAGRPIPEEIRILKAVR